MLLFILKTAYKCDRTVITSNMVGGKPSNLFNNLGLLNLIKKILGVFSWSSTDFNDIVWKLNI